MRPSHLAVVLAALVSSVLWSCGSTGQWDRLPPSDQEAFRRCQEAVRPNLCGPSQDAIYQGICMRDGMGAYSSGADDRTRRQWLLAHGCPPSMVTPDRYTRRTSGHSTL